MDDYKSNSHKSKEVRSDDASGKKVEKAVTSSAKVRKKNEMQRIADVFISEDISNVKTYILMDVLVPSIKKAVSDIVTNGIDMILYGETKKGGKKSTASKISYRNYYERDNERRSERISTGKRNGYDYDDLIFETRGDAEAVLDAMNDIISQYDVVSVGDLYDLANVSTDNYAVNKYGWTDIRGCKCIRVRDGYVLKLPPVLPINKREVVYDKGVLYIL